VTLRLTDLFFEMDTTRTGYVHLPALLDFVKRVLRPAVVPPGQLRRVYALLDAQNDGTVSYKELTLRLNRAKAALRVADAEGGAG
jgi:Ca2+-binding EF-hand superfamily protein